MALEVLVVQLHDVADTCPVCGETMMITRLSCPQCASSLEGTFRVRPTGRDAGSRSGPLPTRSDQQRYGRLTRLDAAQLEFVEVFLRCRGVIKNVEDMLGISYPTVKARLANVLAAMGMDTGDEPPAAEQRRRRREILADLASGRISTQEAHDQLMRARPDGEDGDEDDD
jgi:hypothetical protein